MNKTFTFDTQNGPLTVSEGDVLESFRGERFVIRTPLHTDGLTYCTHETNGYQAGYYPSVFGLVIPATSFEDDHLSAITEEFIRGHLEIGIDRKTSQQIFQDLIAPTTED
tara:strand:+ start:193 stop:522 length:330 start_codon:yes stop_codon:yes gene_type:complete